MEILEKVSYLKGLADGLQIDKEKPEGKLLMAIVGVLDEIAAEIADLSDETDELYEGLEAVSEDLEAVEDIVYECDCDDCYDDEDEFFDDEDGELYEVTCPTCGDTVCVDEGMLDEGSIECPGCGELLEFDLEDCDCDCCCDCEDHE